jgi:glutaredoxin
MISPQEEGWTVYTKSDCVFCDQAKVVLGSYPTVYVNCDEWLETDKETFLKKMKERIGREYRMFPMIFYDGVFIGGYSDTKEYVEKKLSFTEEF